VRRCTTGQCGFTLIETLVALVVAATAAAVILAQVRGLFLRAEREQAAERATIAVLNGIAQLAGTDGDAPGSWRAGGTVPHEDALRLTQPPEDLAAEVAIVNFTVTGSAREIPPVEVAYTPFQRIAVTSGGRELCYLAPALKSPAGMGVGETKPPPAEAAKR